MQKTTAILDMQDGLLISGTNQNQTSQPWLLWTPTSGVIEDPTLSGVVGEDLHIHGASFDLLVSACFCIQQ